MFDSKAEVLRGLDHSNPASIQALIDFHREAFGGYRMVDDGKGGAGGGQPEGDKGGQGGQGGTSGGKSDQGGTGKKDQGDEPLGESGTKALQAERDARKALDAEVKALKTAQADQTRKIAEAFGIKTDDGKTSTDDVVSALQKQVQDMQHDGLVYQLANEHTITDKDDLELLKGVRDETALRKLAARLAKKADDDQGEGGKQKHRPPRQDPNQGRGDGGKAPGSSGSAEADRRFGKQQDK
jgi:hypothetical protein